MERREGRRVLYLGTGLDPERVLGSLPDRERLEIRTREDGAVDEVALNVDCVVTELTLSEGDGVAVAERVRDRDPDLPVVLVLASGEGLGDRGAAAVNAGVTRVVEDPTELAGTVTDVVETHREEREREERLRADSEMFHSLLENIPLSIYFKDERGVHEAVALSMLPEDPGDYIRNEEGKIHQHAHDVLGKTDFDLYAPEHAAAAVSDDWKVMETEEPIVDVIEEGRTPRGEPLYFSTTKAPRYDEDGEVVGLVGVTLDVTERILNRQELERQNERLDEFASVLSHDLRNPLAVAQGYLDMLEDDYDPAYVRECQGSLIRIEEMIEDLLSFAREGEAVVDPVSVDLEEIAREAWANVDTGDARLEVDSDLPLEADPERLQRLLENLFRNSVEHGSDVTDDRSEGTASATNAGPLEAVPDGDGASRRLTIRISDDGPDFVVEDDGVGIPSDDREEVFERGYTTHDDGTGYGLAIVENIASAHGWTVDVSESDDGGARFEFSGVVRTGMTNASMQ